MSGSKTQIVGKIALEYLDRFPDLPSNTIAKKIAHDYPVLFTVERARGLVRYYRGQSGEMNRKQVPKTKHFGHEYKPVDYETARKRGQRD